MTVTKTIIKALGDDGEYTVNQEKKFNHIVRKNAHFFAYLLLAILIMNAMRRSGVKGLRCIVYSFIFAFIYAIADETHQMFVVGRGPGVKDVLIDSSGAILGIGVFMMIKGCKDMIKKIAHV